jgi:hypothetical protein
VLGWSLALGPPLKIQESGDQKRKIARGLELGPSMFLEAKSVPLARRRSHDNFNVLVKASIF